MKTPPKEIWLQFSEKPDGETEHEGVTWCEDKINDSDVRYVIDKRYKPKTKRPRRET